MSAQQLVQVRITDSESGDPVPGVEVRVRSGSNPARSFLSDEAGWLSIPLDPEKSYELSTQHIAYLSDTVRNLKANDKYAEISLTNRYELRNMVTVRGIRAGKQAPMSFSNLYKSDILKQNYGQDLPYVLDQTPGVLVHSDAGAGVGYTGIRIRGVDPTRINVTINGIALNDAESHGVFWVDLPDLASSVNSIQVQRGVGTSTNGSAAFGASMNVSTDVLEPEAFARVQLGAGSFRTGRIALEFGTGIQKGRWGLQGRVSGIRSDGFIDRASSNLKSLFLTGLYLHRRSTFKMVVLKGFEETYQAWYGVPQPKFREDAKELEIFMDDLGISGAYRENLTISSPLTYNYYTYSNEIDHYNQDHYQFFHNIQFGKGLSIRNALHYTRGFGYYEQFQDTRNWLDQTAFSEYGRPVLLMGEDTITSTNLIRRRWLSNHFGGLMSTLHKTWNNRSLDAGLALQSYHGQHYGEVIWAEFANGMGNGYRYYDNLARKTEGNVFVKINQRIRQQIDLFADMQYRAIQYHFEGPDPNGSFADRVAVFHFFNPKAGITWKPNRQQLFYASMAIANREPVRDDFIQSTRISRPDHETLYNLELGTRNGHAAGYYAFSVYAMEYENQLVLTGRINDVGAAVRENVPRSYRRGAEIEGAWKPMGKWELSGNFSASMNRITRYREYIDDWFNGGQVVIDHRNTDLALSPNYVAGMTVTFKPLKSLNFQILGKAVGRQYLDNTSSPDRMLDPFSLIHFQSKYLFEGENSSWELGVQVNNLTNVVYAPHGYTFGAWLDGERKSYNYVFPQAGRNAMIRLIWKI